jgi:hypothetical protein
MGRVIVQFHNVAFYDGVVFRNKFYPSAHSMLLQHILETNVYPTTSSEFLQHKLKRYLFFQKIHNVTEKIGNKDYLYNKFCVDAAEVRNNEFPTKKLSVVMA